LLAVGLVVVYAISPGLAEQRGVGENYFISKQILAVVLGFVVFLTTSNIPLPFWRKLEKPLVAVSILGSAIVLALGDKVNGATRWIQLGGLSFQPAELIKFALLIWLAGFLSEKLRRDEAQDARALLKPLLIVIGSIGLVVGILQSDLGSTAVMIAMIAAMLFMAGIPLKRVFTLGLVVLAVVALLIAVTPYRRDRLLTFLHPESDCIGKGYQACQALIAVGSGGLMGLGLGHSVQAYGYLPEAANDSIFAIYAEKFGFIGVMALFVLLGVFVRRIIRVVEYSNDEYTRLLGAGILAWFSTQAIINIGAMLGLLPLKGITLPFVSYGGTSMLLVMGALGVLFQLSRYTSYRLPVQNREGRDSHDDSRDGRRFRGAYHPTHRSR
jgi:cell division protein FtsW